jgi:hypothetical protein
MMVNLFSQFSLPQISAVARRTVLLSSAVGVAAIVIGVLVDYPFVGLGVCLGLFLALVNFRLISRATVKAAGSPDENKRRPLVLNTLGRLGVISVIALGLTYFAPQPGFGTLLGLAFFQFALLGNIVVAMLRNPLLGDATLGTARDGGDDE